MIEGVVPAARDISEFSIAELPSGERVLFDIERLQYHTLNEVAFSVLKFGDVHDGTFRRHTRWRLSRIGGRSPS